MPDPADAMKQIDGLPTSLGQPPQILAAVTVETAQQPSAASQPEPPSLQQPVTDQQPSAAPQPEAHDQQQSGQQTLDAELMPGARPQLGTDTEFGLPLNHAEALHILFPADFPPASSANPC